jgi:hypothetical protein
MLDTALKKRLAIAEIRPPRAMIFLGPNISLE